MEIQEIACIVGVGAVTQLLSAVLGPRFLRLVSFLFVMGAAGTTAYLLHQAFSSQFAGIGADAIGLAQNFALIGAGLGVTHYIVSALFRCMARCSNP
ncbi:MAG: hypothetical protein ACT4N2_12805 [Hyphomicrobium sp.]